jgi:putative (di)nucleoside polyphosphate hydrolase
MTGAGPIFTATPDAAYRRNVGIMLLNPQGLAWVGRRLDMPDETWQMPQGGIDPGEAPEAAAMRELEEEIGTAEAEILCEAPGWLTYDLPPDLAGRFWKGQWRGQAQRWFALRFTGSDSDIDVATKHPEFGAWRWVPRTDLPRLIVPFKRPVYEAVVAEFEPRLRAFGL